MLEAVHPYCACVSAFKHFLSSAGEQRNFVSPSHQDLFRLYSQVHEGLMGHASQTCLLDIACSESSKDEARRKKELEYEGLCNFDNSGARELAISKQSLLTLKMASSEIHIMAASIAKAARASPLPQFSQMCDFSVFEVLPKIRLTFCIDGLLRTSKDANKECVPIARGK